MYVNMLSRVLNEHMKSFTKMRGAANYDLTNFNVVDFIDRFEEIIQERYEKACREVELAHMYDYIVVNDTVENAADKIMAIIRAEHAKTRRTFSEYMKMVEDK